MTSIPRQPKRPFLFLLALAMPLSFTGCRKTAPEDAEKPIVSVQAVHPELGSISEQIVGDAILAPVAQAAIQAKITAPIKAFYVQRGAHVTAGQLLATLENQDLAAAALDTQGAYQAAQGTFTTATRQQVPQEQTQAQLDLTQAKATLDLDQTILTARTQLLSQGAIPGRDVDTARAAVNQAQAAYQIAKQKFDSITSVGKAASLETAQGQLTSAKGKYLGAEAQLHYTSIRTPISGVVTERPLFAGETASAGTAVITVMDTSVLIGKLHLAQRQAQQLMVGAPATLLIPGIEDPIKAKVSLISPALDPGSTTVEVWLRVDNRDGTLKAGTSVHAAIQGRTVANALILPAEAIQRSTEGGDKIVLTVSSDNKAHKKSVTLGVQTPTNVQIVEGLSPTDTVITTGNYGIDEAAKVKIESAGARPEAGEKE